MTAIRIIATATLALLVAIPFVGAQDGTLGRSLGLLGNDVSGLSDASECDDLLSASADDLRDALAANARNTGFRFRCAERCTTGQAVVTLADGRVVAVEAPPECDVRTGSGAGFGSSGFGYSPFFRDSSLPSGLFEDGLSRSSLGIGVDPSGDVDRYDPFSSSSRSRSARNYDFGDSLFFGARQSIYVLP